MAGPRLLGGWTPRERARAAGVLCAVAVLHAVGFGTLALAVSPGQQAAGAQVLSLGLGLTAYMLGLRHAFDPDHIAAIDNVTRKLAADGSRPASVGFWFAAGHSAMVVALALLVVGAATNAGTLLDDTSPTRRVLGVAGTLASGGFLYLIAIVNLVALVGIYRVFVALRGGRFDERALEDQLAGRGVLARALRPVIRRISRPRQMFAVGVLFGLGFDTATEVTLLALAGSGAAAGVPWWAVLTLPALFAAGMCLMDSADGIFMSAAYDWAFASPVRKIYYNITVTGLSVAVALVVGTAELLGLLSEQLGWRGGLWDWVAALDLDVIGFVIVGMFVLTWLLAVLVWRFGRIEQRWAATPEG
ncbi:MAG: HoxN/HupN/NixA family nickel/cobalt transporter [Mycobacterium sp.]